MRRPVACLAATAALLLAVAAPGSAASGPDLDAFSGCLSAHSAAAGYVLGNVPTPALVQLVVATIGASDTQGARKAVKALRRAKTPAKTQRALGRVTKWCIAHGVPPITVATTAVAAPVG